MALNIERINSKLEGEFFFRGKKWSVPFTVPGDAVQFKLNRRGRKLSLEVLHVEKSTEITADPALAAALIDPLCPYFGRCGGCRGQHLKYEYQLSLKTEPVIRSMKEKFHINPKILPAHILSGHRHRMDFSVNETAVGFHPAGDFAKILDTETCPVQSENGNRALKILRDAVRKFSDIGFNRENLSGIVKYATIRYGKTGSLILTCDEENFSDEKSADLLRGFTEYLITATEEQFENTLSVIFCTSSRGSEISCTPNGEVISGTDTFRIELGGMEFDIPYDSFFQPNPGGFNGLIDWSESELALNLTDSFRGELLDLYSGAGILSSIFANRLKSSTGYTFDKIKGYDFIASSIDRAKNNFDSFPGEVKFFAADLNNKFDPETNPFLNNISLILADPPRAGLSPAVVKNILENSRAPFFLYISCNPESQIRDLELLEEKYSVMNACLADCFPHTGHLEQAVILRKKI